MGKLEAVLWDVDGTIAETERDGHRVAFNLAFEACAVPWRWDEARYGELLRVTGGRERLLYDMKSRSETPASAAGRDALAGALHAKKNAFYADIVRDGHLPLRAGVAQLMAQCRARRVRMGIATTTSRLNVDALLRFHLGPQWAGWFSAIVCGEDVARKKPDPAVYVQALQQLGIGPFDAVAIEDSPGGVAAAREAGVPVVVTPSAYFDCATIDGAMAIGPGLQTRCGWRPALRAAAADSAAVGLDEIEAWRAETNTVSRRV